MNITDNIKKLYRQNLVDMGMQYKNSDFNDIYSPEYTEKEIRRFMSDHYQTEEGVQSQNFELYDYYEALINRAIKVIDRNTETEYNILELGAGFGSATIPLLRLFPNSTVVATELSLPMLARLKSNLKNTDFGSRCMLLQLNAEEPDFEENSFDFIFGAAILHHLFNPVLVFERAYKILKPGGCAIFFEPFSEGYNILADFYKTILRESGFSANQFSFIEKVFNKIKMNLNLNRKQIDKNLVSYFFNSVYGWNKMKSNNKSGHYFTNVDDKWLFTKQYFIDIKNKYNYSDCIFFEVTTFDEVFRTHTTGNTNVNMPDWIITKFAELEGKFTDSEKKDTFTEGCILMIK